MTCLLLSLLLIGEALAGFADEAAARGVSVGGTTNGPAIWLDYDNDGTLDILATSDAGVTLLRGDGAGGFTDASAQLATGLRGYTDVRSVIAADLSNDGFVDLALGVASQVGPSELVIWLGDGQGFPGYLGLPHYHQQNPNGYVLGIGAADFNRDGWLDLIYGRANDTPELFLALGERTGGFYLYDVAAASYSEHLAVGDLNQDGAPDLIARMAGEYDIQLGTSTGAFTSGQTDGFGFDFDASASDHGGVALCDLDEDGLPDIIRTRGGADFTRSYGGARVFLFDTEARTFAASSALVVGNTDLNGIACGDVDNDGDQDLYLAGASGGLLLNGLDANGALSFSNTFDPISGGGWVETSAHFADFDADGDADLLVARSGVDHALLVNDSGGEALALSMKVDLGAWLDGACDGATLRDDVGGRAHLIETQEPYGLISGVRMVSGGGGYGGMDAPVMVFGLADAPDEVKLEYAFAHPAVSETVHVKLSGTLLGGERALTVTTNDFDGDGISNAHEGYLDQGSGLWDPDGDGYGAWEDLDSDGDGVLDRDEAGDADLCTAPCDRDGDGVGDWLDPSVDGTGCPQDTGDTGTATDDSGGHSGADDTRVTADDSAPVSDDSGGSGAWLGLSGGVSGCACAAGGGPEGLGLVAWLALLALRRRRPDAPA